MTPAEFDRLLGSDVSEDVRLVSQGWQARDSSAGNPLEILTLALDQVERIPEVSQLQILRHADAILSRSGEGKTSQYYSPMRDGISKGQTLLGGRRFKERSLRRSLWPPLVATALGLLAIVVGWHVAPRLREYQAIAVSTYTTANGQRANITLPDGNTVALNVASRLDVPVDYASGNRTLRLTGEALFTVLHQTEIPLTVMAGTVTARVLGTSFVVRHYATDTLTTVAVRQGKVAVRSLVLTAGRQMEMSQSDLTQVRSVDPSQFSFATGVLTLESVPLPAAIPELDRWYGVDIRLGSPSLTTRRINGNLTVGSLTDVTALLEMTFDVRVVRDGRVLTLIPR